jgi:hypothetical protein
MDPVQDKSLEDKQSAKTKTEENSQNSVTKESSTSPYDTSFFDNQKLDIPECLSGLSTEHARKVLDRVPTEKLAQICAAEFNKMKAPDLSANPLGGMHQATVIAGMESILSDEARPLLIRDGNNKSAEFKNYVDAFKKDFESELEKDDVRESVARQLPPNYDVEKFKKEMGDSFDEIASSVRNEGSFLHGDGAVTSSFNETMSLIYLPRGNTTNSISNKLLEVGGGERVSELNKNPKVADFFERFAAYHEAGHVDDYRLLSGNSSRSMFLGEAESDAVASLKVLSDGIKEGAEPQARYALQLWSDYRNSAQDGFGSSYLDTGKAVTEVLGMDSAEIVKLSDKDLVSLGSRIAERSVPDEPTLAERGKALDYIAPKIFDQSLIDETGKLKQDPELISALETRGVSEALGRAFTAYQNLNAPVPSALEAIHNYYSTSPNLKSY